MNIRIHRASESDLAKVLQHARSDSLTYAPIGATLETANAPTPAPPGLTRRHWSTQLHGTDAFERAVTALTTWVVHRGAGLELAADGTIAVGTNVAFSAPLPVGFIDATCRIVAVVGDAKRYGFAYGTLSIHPEQGEESFVVSKDGHGDVTFDIVGLSRPKQPLARLLPSIADRLQDRAVRRYLSAMEHAIAAG